MLFLFKRSTDKNNPSQNLKATGKLMNWKLSNWTCERGADCRSGDVAFPHAHSLKWNVHHLSSSDDDPTVRWTESHQSRSLCVPAKELDPFMSTFMKWTWHNWFSPALQPPVEDRSDAVQTSRSIKEYCILYQCPVLTKWLFNYYFICSQSVLTPERNEAWYKMCFLM